ncbi:MAG: ATPase [Tissierellia bacterium]|nr:ATPase [Tissierellia bacterium]
MDVLRLIDELEEKIETASNVPFSGKIMLEKDNILDIVQQLRLGLPDEIKQAAWIKDERDRIINEAETTAKEKITHAEEKAAKLLDENEIVIMAEEKAKSIIDIANSESTAIKEGARDYADDILKNTQENLSEVIRMLNDNRQELK